MFRNLAKINRRIKRFLGTSVPGEGIWLAPPGSPPGMNWHEAFILHLVAVMRPSVYVELGIHRCILFNQIVPYAKQLIGVDIKEYSGRYMLNSPKTRFVCASTNEFAEELRLNPIKIDVLFIDADHSREAVLSDFWNFFPFVAPHGLILLHDVHPADKVEMDPAWCGTAHQAAEELSHCSDAYELLTIPVSPGLAICRKRSIQLSWQEDKT